MDDINSFLMDAKLFGQAMSSLEVYLSSLQEAYSVYSSIEEAPQESLDDLKDQIEVVETLLENFRFAVRKSINTGTSTTH